MLSDVPDSVRAAAQAEISLRRAQLSRLARRAIFISVGIIFALFALVSVHVAGFLWLASSGTIGPVWAALTVFATDLVLAMTCALVAAGMVASPAEREAVERCRGAWAELREPFAPLTTFGRAAATAIDRIRRLVRTGSPMNGRLARRGRWSRPTIPRESR